MAQRVWLVTGCSSGFGVEFIKGILQRGDKAIATARNVDSLKPLVDLGAAALQLDITASQDELEDKIKQAVQIYGHVDVMIANAGYVETGAVEEMGDKLLTQMRTNTFGTMNLVTAIMPHWRERKSGFLVVNSSFLAWWSTFPGGGAYSASKAALNRLVDTFALEVADLGYIKTLVINPGHFATDVAAPTKHDLSRKSQNYPAIDTMLEYFTANVHGNQPGDAAKAVSVTLDVVRGEGVAQGKPLPPFLPLGKDAYTDIKAHAEMTLKVLEEWKDVIQSTDRA